MELKHERGYFFPIYEATLNRTNNGIETYLTKHGIKIKYALLIAPIMELKLLTHCVIRSLVNS